MHTPLLARVARNLLLAERCHDRGEAPAAARAAAVGAASGGLTRRRLLAAGAAAAATAAFGRVAFAGKARPAPRIAIVGAGLAGLVCADALRAKGLAATVYDASSRVGGRCFSLRGFFPGQVAERGGEFIDTTHQTMRHYATEFKLLRDDVTKADGDVLYHFAGALRTDDEVVAEYRRLVPRIRADLKTLSAEPTFFDNTAADRALDQLSLADWLASRAGDLPLVRAAIDEAYVAEYGLETSEQSSLNFLLFIHADRRRRFTPFGVFSDERFHLAGGNDAIPTAIAARLPGPIELSRRLVRLSRAGGEFRLDFASGPSATADFVVMTLPFSVLRGIDLDASLGLSADKIRAIQTLGYGANAKTMIGFQGRPWAALGGNGSFYSDKPNVQTTWETSPGQAGATSVLTDYAGGVRGAAIGAVALQTQVATFLSDFNAIVPGAAAAATRPGGGTDVLAFREHWPSNPLSLGGYTCYRPGQFTGIAGLEGEPAGALKFAGEHTDSFYSAQGFMEGACLSGLRAADEILADVKAG